MSHSSTSTIQANACAVCGSTTARLLYTTRDRLKTTADIFQIVECCACSIRRTLPEMDESELAKYYPNDYWGGVPSAEWIQASQADKTEFVNSCLLRGGRILDVGCGAGFFLRALDERLWQSYGVEIGAAAAQAAGQALGREKIFQGTLLEANFADDFFEALTFWSALEHTNEPKANLLEARRIIKTGGTLIVQVPNIASYQANLFKGDWFSLDAPRHRYHFNLQTLQSLFAATGFEIYQQTFQSKVHNAHALRQSLKARLWEKSMLHRAAFLVAIPFLKPFDFFMSASGKGATMTVAARAI
jgi:SAM-dependent methyltransferase